jgi:membrane-associated phospholipid phosphatase
VSTVVRHFVGLAAAIAIMLFTNAAWATDPDRVEWSPDWRRVHVVEGLNVVALTFASIEIDNQWTPKRHPSWTGGILFDDAVRNALRGRTATTQQRASDLSDYLYRGGVLAPYVVDVFLTTLSIHQNADVALQMLLINLQSLGITGVASLATEHAVGRARPYTRDCGPDGTVRDAAGRVMNVCGGDGDNTSFFSGHSSATATMAGLTCVHHQHLPLYGGGVADLAPCVVMIGASLTTGVARVVADKHYASDVIVGWGVGALSGYVLPSVMHYGFGHGKALGQIDVGGAHMLPVPQANAGGAGFALVGSF